MASMWAKYKKEREGKEVLEWKNAFTLYSYPGDGICYIEDNWVDPSERRKGLAKAMANEIVAEARNKGCHTLVGSVSLGSANPGDNMRVLLAYGMEPYHIEGKLVYFKKSI